MFSQLPIRVEKLFTVFPHTVPYYSLNGDGSITKKNWMSRLVVKMRKCFSKKFVADSIEKFAQKAFEYFPFFLASQLLLKKGINPRNLYRFDITQKGELIQKRGLSLLIARVNHFFSPFSKSSREKVQELAIKLRLMRQFRNTDLRLTLKRRFIQALSHGFRSLDMVRVFLEYRWELLTLSGLPEDLMGRILSHLPPEEIKRLSPYFHPSVIEGAYVLKKIKGGNASIRSFCQFMVRQYSGRKKGRETQDYTPLLRPEEYYSSCIFPFKDSARIQWEYMVQALNKYASSEPLKVLDLSVMKFEINDRSLHIDNWDEDSFGDLDCSHLEEVALSWKQLFQLETWVLHRSAPLFRLLLVIVGNANSSILVRVPKSLNNQPSQQLVATLISLMGYKLVDHNQSQLTWNTLIFGLNDNQRDFCMSIAIMIDASAVAQALIPYLSNLDKFLSEAASWGRRFIATLLIQKGAQVKQRPVAESPLHQAILFRKFEMVKFLKNHDEQSLVGTKDAIRLEQALQRFDMSSILRVQIRDFLLSNAFPEAIGNSLELVARRGYYKLVRFFIENHRKSLNREALGKALCASARKGHLEIAELLLEEGADVNFHHKLYTRRATHKKRENPRILMFADKLKRTPLTCAILSKSPQLVQFLIDKGCDTTLITMKYFDGLDYLIQKASVDVLKVLIGNHLKISFSFSGIHRLIEICGPEILECLFDRMKSPIEILNYGPFSNIAPGGTFALMLDFQTEEAKNTMTEFLEKNRVRRNNRIWEVAKNKTEQELHNNAASYLSVKYHDFNDCYSIDLRFTYSRYRHRGRLSVAKLSILKP